MERPGFGYDDVVDKSEKRCNDQNRIIRRSLLGSVELDKGKFVY